MYLSLYVYVYMNCEDIPDRPSHAASSSSSSSSSSSPVRKRHTHCASERKRPTEATYFIWHKLKKRPTKKRLIYIKRDPQEKAREIKRDLQK